MNLTEMAEIIVETGVDDKDIFLSFSRQKVERTSGGAFMFERVFMIGKSEINRVGMGICGFYRDRDTLFDVYYDSDKGVWLIHDQFNLLET